MVERWGYQSWNSGYKLQSLEAHVQQAYQYLIDNEVVQT